MLTPEQLARYRDPAWWDQAITIRWLFAVAGHDLAVSVRSTDRDELAAATPRIHEFLDAISTQSGGPMQPVTGSWQSCEAAIFEVLAAAAADERRVTDEPGQ